MTDKNQRPIYLHFKSGVSFQGSLFKAKDENSLETGIWGEAAFTTSMSGYQETITDPSYLGQHLIFCLSAYRKLPSTKR